MAEEAPEKDPIAEARRIVSMYINSMGWSRENKRRITTQFGPVEETDKKLRNADESELLADENFGKEIDSLRQEKSKTSIAILEEILKLLDKRSDLTFFGKRMRERIREDLSIF